ncbi:MULTISPECIES: NADPH-dependent F420 reductase [unclassified Streptomyces]|uniref:NADPH-dependent F420 reductase n=1 Tax=unclassified Streptomyces TaxID=2593676 RepID=UPI0037A4E1DB
MSTISVLGSGSVARALAGQLHGVGHRVVVGSRAPQTTAADWTGSGVRVTGLLDAAGSAEVVINATPGSASLEVLTGLAAPLTGKVLVDVANATAFDSAGFASALLYPGSSLAEEIQQALPDVRVVKTLNTLHASVMADPTGLTVAPSAFVSGNDADAKSIVGRLLADLGWPPEWIIDLGDVSTARVPEAFVLMVSGLVGALGPVPFGMAIAR